MAFAKMLVTLTFIEVALSTDVKFFKQRHNYCSQEGYVLFGVCLSVCLSVSLLATSRKNY